MFSTSAVDCRSRDAAGAGTAPLAIADAGPTADYFAQYVYDRKGFIASLQRTRVRQAVRWLELVREFAPGAGRMLDFGCGHGWFLREAARAGFGALVGADASQIAVDELRQLRIDAVLVPSERPEELDSSALPFRPQVLTLLDVIEHFPVDRVRDVIAGLADRLQPDLQLLLVKVPVSSGLLHRIASALSRAGVTGPLEQLYQVGTSPPHFSYFSRSSLERLLTQCGFKVVGWAGDCDFEPDGLADRIRVLSRLPRWVAHGFGSTLAATARALHMEDALVCVATPCGR